MSVLFRWEWNEQPPLGKIAEDVFVLSGGRIHLDMHETGSSQYELAVYASGDDESQDYRDGWNDYLAGSLNLGRCDFQSDELNDYERGYTDSATEAEARIDPGEEPR